MAGLNRSLREVAFQGRREATGPIAWGQCTTWDDIHYFLPDTLPFFVLKRMVPVPAGLSLDDVLAELAELVSRHETLRSHYFLEPSGDVTTSVVRSGTLAVTVLDVDSPPSEMAEETLKPLVYEISGTWFDHATELPVRPGVLVYQGIPALVVLGISHVSVDMQAAGMLAAELTDLLSARRAGVPRPAAVEAMQPIDVAAWEHSERGQRKSESALAHRRKQLDVIAPTMFGDPRPGESPRYWRGCLTSTAVPLALRILDERYTGGIPAILLSTDILLLHALTGSDQVTVGLVFGNRTTADTRPVISSLSETVITTFTRGQGTFADLVSRTWSTCMRSYMHGRFDDRAAVALTEQVGRERGVQFDLTCRFNDTWSFGLADKPEGAVLDPETVRAALPESTFHFPDQTDLDKITFYVDIGGDGQTVRLNLLADTRRVPPASIEAFLRGYEQALVALAERDLCLDHAALASGLPGTPFLGRQQTPRHALRCACAD